MSADAVRAGLDLLHEFGPEAILECLDPDVEMLGRKPSPWDCHGCAEVIRFPYDFVQDSFSIIAFRDGWLSLMRGYPNRDEAMHSIARR